MSPRDTYWFLAGTASGLMAGALGVYFLIGTSTHSTTPNTSNLLMPGDSWPTLADASVAGTNPTGSAVTKDDSAAAAKGANAGALDEVTRSLAERLATKGGTDNEWRLLAQSYDYMGRTEEARAARTHVAATEGSRISGTVQISADLAAHAAPGTTLFIYATDGSTSGPPLAVLRLRVDRWPVSFVLDDADAMIPGRNLSGAQSVQLEARISPSGEALPRPGDLIGNLANVDPHTTHAVNISIDHKIS
jgi:cytochrome c-type biogenesis protein CcmH